MGARVKMAPQTLTGEMLLLIEAQADNAEVFTFPGAVAAQMARLARRGLAAAAAAETPRSVNRRAAVEEAALLAAARSTVRFLSSEQREALKRALTQ